MPRAAPSACSGGGQEHISAQVPLWRCGNGCALQHEAVWGWGKQPQPLTAAHHVQAAAPGQRRRCAGILAAAVQHAVQGAPGAVLCGWGENLRGMGRAGTAIERKAQQNSCKLHVQINL
jgi:hypothetical protein